MCFRSLAKNPVPSPSTIASCADRQIASCTDRQIASTAGRGTGRLGPRQTEGTFLGGRGTLGRSEGGVVEVTPTRDDHDGGHDRHQQHQGQTDTVQAEGVVGAQRGDPRGLLAELHAATDVELHGEDDRQEQRQHRNGQGHLLRQSSPQEDQRDRADRWQQGEHSKDREAHLHRPLSPAGPGRARPQRGQRPPPWSGRRCGRSRSVPAATGSIGRRSR